MSTAQTTVKAYWSLNTTCTIYLNLNRESFDTYKTVLIGQSHETVVNGYKIIVVEVGTVHLQMSITNKKNKVLIKNVVLNGVLHALEGKESLIAVPCLTERRLKVKFDQVSDVITGQHSVERTAKRVDRM